MWGDGKVRKGFMAQEGGSNCANFIESLIVQVTIQSLTEQKSPE